MEKKFFLDELLEELRTLSEHYELEEDDTDVFVLKANEGAAFAEDVIRIVKDYVQKEFIMEEIDEDESLDNEDLNQLYWLDDDDELE